MADFTQQSSIFGNIFSVNVEKESISEFNFRGIQLAKYAIWRSFALLMLFAFGVGYIPKPIFVRKYENEDRSHYFLLDEDGDGITCDQAKYVAADYYAVCFNRPPRSLREIAMTYERTIGVLTETSPLFERFSKNRESEELRWASTAHRKELGSSAEKTESVQKETIVSPKQKFARTIASQSKVSRKHDDDVSKEPTLETSFSKISYPELILSSPEPSIIDYPEFILSPPEPSIIDASTVEQLPVSSSTKNFLQVPHVSKRLKSSYIGETTEHNPLLQTFERSTEEKRQTSIESTTTEKTQLIPGCSREVATTIQKPLSACAVETRTPVLRFSEKVTIQEFLKKEDIAEFSAMEDEDADEETPLGMIKKTEPVKGRCKQKLVKEQFKFSY